MLNFKNSRDKTPISFDYKGKHYEGKLQPVNGAGTNVWHLSINNYYYGKLRYIDKWVFHSNSNEMNDLADLFGKHVSLSCE
jgi:hypothetical protein